MMMKGRIEINNCLLLVIAIFWVFLPVAGFSQWIGFQGSLVGTDIEVRDPAKNDIYSPVPGFRLGPSMEFRFNRYVSMETGMNFTSGGAYMTVKKGNESDFYDIKANIRTYYLELPLITRFYLPLNGNTALFVHGGICGSRGMDGTVTYTENHNGKEQQVSAPVEWGEDPDTDDFKLLNLCAIAGIGAQYRHFQFTFQYSQGILDISPYADRGVKMHTQSLNLSVHYKITWIKHLIMPFHEYNKDLFIFTDY
jgi:hypothetical protein